MAADLAALTQVVQKDAAAQRAALAGGPFAAQLALYPLRLEQALASDQWRRQDAGVAPAEASGAAAASAPPEGETTKARKLKAKKPSAKKAAKALPKRKPKTPPLARPAAHVAGAALGRAEKRLARWGARLDTLSIEERHEMRKKAKVLRYAVEFFGSLYPDLSVKPYRRAVKQLQASFGALNDAADVAKLGELEVSARLKRSIEAAVAASEARMRAEFPQTKARWRALSETADFWR